MHNKNKNIKLRYMSVRHLLSSVLFFCLFCSCFAASYSESSQVWALSFLPGIVNSQRANNSDTLQILTEEAMNEVLQNNQTQQLIGNWEIEWGPVIYARRLEITTHSDNCIMIVKNSTEPTWLIGIAGTNPFSIIDWIQDFNVRDMVPWSSIVSSAPSTSGAIAKGTEEGLSNIIHKMKYNRKTILDYLKTINFPENSTVYVAGHSLGGALTCTYGLYLQETKDQWDPKGMVNLRIRPSAGPTPGNSTWNDYFFEKIQYNLDNSRFISPINSLDIVPHAFDDKTLLELPSIYDVCIPAIPAINDSVNIVIDYANHQYAFMDYQTIFTGEFEYFSQLSCDDTGPIDALAYYFNEAGYQHMNGYYSPLGIQDFISIMTLVQQQVYGKTSF